MLFKWHLSSFFIAPNFHCVYKIKEMHFVHLFYLTIVMIYINY